MSKTENGLVAFENKLADLGTLSMDVGEIQPHWDESTENNGIVKRRLTWITVPAGLGKTKKLQVTPRFLRSLAARFHVGEAFFKYFTPEEVFDRLQKVHPRVRVRLTVDKDKALAMSNPAKGIVHPEDLARLLRDQEGRVTNVEYHLGVVTSTHEMDDAPWSVGGDAFKQTFTLETPVDGLGLPSVYLSLIRQICTNGMIGYAPAFRTTIAIGKDDGDNPILPLSRAMECFSNDEGFDALRQRLETSLNSEASVFEVRMLAKAIHADLHGRRTDIIRSGDIFTALTDLTGDVALKYAVASEEAICRKKQSQLSMDCTVYDLLNFATEIISHHGDLLSDGATKTMAWVGQTLADAGGYDLENSLETANDNWHEIENESERLRQERRWNLKQREAPALHLNGKLRDTQMIHAISGQPVPDATTTFAAARLSESWNPDDADIDVDD